MRGDGLQRRDCKLVRIKVMNINHTGRLVSSFFPRGRPLTALHGPCQPPHTIVSSFSPFFNHTCAHLSPSRAYSRLAEPGVARPARLSRCQSTGPLFTPPPSLLSEVHVFLARTPPSHSLSSSSPFPCFSLLSSPVGTVYGRICERFDADMATACQVVRT